MWLRRALPRVVRPDLVDLVEIEGEWRRRETAVTGLGETHASGGGLLRGETCQDLL
jgi:hypothetical protein